MTGYGSSDLPAFNRLVIALLDFEELLAYAIPALQNYFQRQCVGPVNLRLGFNHHFKPQALLPHQTWFPAFARLQAFLSHLPDWNEETLELNETGLAGTCLARQRPVYLAGNEEIANLPPDRPVLAQAVCFPLSSLASQAPQPEALLEVELTETVSFNFDAELQESLVTFGTALGNARRFTEAQQSIYQLKTLNANTTDLISQPRLQTILEITVRRAMSLLQAEAGGFYIVDYEHREVECVLDVNLNAPAVGTRLKFGEGAAGRVAETGLPLVLDDYSQWEGQAKVFQGRTDFKAVLQVPVLWQEEVIGVISLLRMTPHSRFTQQDVELVSQFAAQTAAAISNSRLLETTLRSKRELEMVYQAAALVNSNLKIQALCEAFVTELENRFGYRYIFVYLIDREGQPRLLSQRGYDNVIKTLPSTGLCSRAMQTRQPQLVLDASQEPDFIYAIPATGGVYVPVILESELLGLIGLEVVNQRLGESDLRLLETLSSHLSIAIRNARLFEQVERHAEQLKRRNQELETVFAGLTEGLLVVRPQGEEFHWRINPEGLRLLGWGDRQPSQAELTDFSAYAFYEPLAKTRHFSDRAEIPPASRPLTLAEWPSARATKGERFTGLELVVKGPDGARRCLSFSGAPMTNRQGRVVQAVVVFQDVTAVRALEQMKEGFLSLVSHDLRAPLAAISGFAEQAEIDLDSGEPQRLQSVRRSLEVINRHSNRLNRLVNDLLDMARLESGGLQLDLHPFNLAYLVRETCNHLVETIPQLAGLEPDPHALHRPYLRLDLDRNLPPVLIDQQRFDQVLTNLISNAVKYSNRGGEILVQLTADPANPAYARLVVRDQGIGIAPEKLPRLFNRFYRAEQVRGPAFTGVGLGLYICHMMVEALNGRIWAESEGVGLGSTFYVTLPFAQG